MISLGMEELGVFPFCEEERIYPPRLLWRKTGAGTTEVCCIGSRPDEVLKSL
jgi:hypothetical protein